MNYLLFGKSYIKNQTALQPISVIKFPNLFQSFMSDANGFFAKRRKDHAEMRIFTFQKHRSEITVCAVVKFRNEQNIYICLNKTTNNTKSFLSTKSYYSSHFNFFSSNIRSSMDVLPIILIIQKFIEWL